MSHMKRRDGNKIRRMERKAQAKVRQEIADKRTLEEKVRNLGRMTATKERAKLQKKLGDAASKLLLAGAVKRAK